MGKDLTEPGKKPKEIKENLVLGLKRQNETWYINFDRKPKWSP